LLAKAAVLLIFLTLFELIALPAFAAFLLGPPLLPALPGLLVTLLLANVGIAIVGTLIGAIAVHSRTRELIVALIALPLLLPIVIAAAKASSPLLVGGSPEPLPLRWLGILALYDMVFALVTYAISDLLLDD
jgi:heme exporter protein B